MDLHQIMGSYLPLRDYPLLSSYRNTEQDKIWHAEGSVHIHTEMVMSQASILAVRCNLSDRDSLILYTAAVFHDYAKPLTTKEVERDGRMCVTAKGHEELGASLLTFSRKPFYLTDDEWSTVIDLVRYHDKPKMLTRQSAPSIAYAELAVNCKRLDLLYMLEVCDMKGRWCDDLDVQLLHLDLYEHECSGLRWWNFNLNDYKPSHLSDRIFNTLLSRAVDTRNPPHSLTIHTPETVLYWMDILAPTLERSAEPPKLIILCGLPGSGKSTLAVNQYPTYAKISLDDIRSTLSNRSDQSQNDTVVRIAHEQLKSLLREGRDVVFDATNYRRDFRTKIAEVGFAYKAYVEVVVVKTDVFTCIDRDAKREHKVGAEVINNILRSFQLPNISECHKVTYVK